MASVKDNILLVKTAIKSLGELGVSREVYTSSLVAFDESIAKTRQQALEEVLEKVRDRLSYLREALAAEQSDAFRLSIQGGITELDSMLKSINQQIES